MANLPPWGRDELPEPLPFSPKNGAKTIGPGTILLATAIGGGEWMAGPSDDASLHTQCRDLAEGLAEELTYAGRDEALRDLQANTIWRATNQKRRAPRQPNRASGGSSEYRSLASGSQPRPNNRPMWQREGVFWGRGSNRV